MEKKIKIGKPDGIYCDFKYSIDGVWSEKSYVSYGAAKKAAQRKIGKTQEEMQVSSLKEVVSIPSNYGTEQERDEAFMNR